MYISSRESRRCPAEFQNRLTRRFGTNPFGDPLFKIVWGASEFHRIGNIWRDKQGTERRGYMERFVCHGMPCWNILRWKSAAMFGSQDLWYRSTWDHVSQMHSLGEYPWRGRYEIVQPLMWRDFDAKGNLVIHHMPLSHILIDEAIPLLVQIERMSTVERKAAEEACREFERRQKQKEHAEIAEKMMENLPSFYGPVSFNGQGCRTALIDKKMYQIEQAIGRLSAGGRRPTFRKGFQVGRAPRMGRI